MIHVASKALELSFQSAYDLVLMGKIIEKGYFVHFRQINSSISPFNNVLLSLAPKKNKGEEGGEEISIFEKNEKLTEKLIKVYSRTGNANETNQNNSSKIQEN